MEMFMYCTNVSKKVLKEMRSIVMTFSIIKDYFMIIWRLFGKFQGCLFGFLATIGGEFFPQPPGLSTEMCGLCGREDCLQLHQEVPHVLVTDSPHPESRGAEHPPHGPGWRVSQRESQGRLGVPNSVITGLCVQFYVV